MNDVRTLAFDVGGTRLKAAVLDAAGGVVAGPVRSFTPRPAGPDVVVPILIGLARQLDQFDRVSVGFPGVVRDGMILSAPNLGTPAWRGTRLTDLLSQEFGKPVRALNDGSVQGLGVIRGRKIEVVITLGTGMGFALFRSGRLAPHLELGQHPVRSDKSYDQYVGNAALKACGVKRWNRRVRRVIGYLETLTNFDRLYIGGGNSKEIRFKLPEDVEIVPNQAGLTGGVRLWDLMQEEDFAA